MSLLTEQQTERLKAFYLDVASWSCATFGSNQERGVEGPIKHLMEEIEEVKKEFDPIRKIEELADCLIIFADILYRDINNKWFTLVGWAEHTPWMCASFDLLMTVAEAKMYKNKMRAWNKKSASDPVHHAQEAKLPVYTWLQNGLIWRPCTVVGVACAPWGTHIELKGCRFEVFFDCEFIQKTDSFVHAHWVFTKCAYQHLYAHEEAQRAENNKNQQLSKAQKSDN